MTGPAPHLDDDRLSALVDGMARPEDAAHAAGCPDCGARLAAWQAAVARVATPPVLPDDVAVHRAVAAALDSGGTSSITELSEVRWRRTLRAPAAAAAAVLAVLGLSLGLAQIGSGSHHNGHSATAGAAAPSGAKGTGASSSTIAGPLQDLGRFGNAAALVPALERLIGPGTTPNVQQGVPVANAQATHGCAAQASQAFDQHRSSAAPTAQAEIIFKGVPSIVSVFSSAGGHTAVVTDSSCTVEARFPFP